MERLIWENLAPITLVGDEFTAVGVVCLDCGETLITVPERIHKEQPGWFGCQRCKAARTRILKAEAIELFAEAGLRLIGGPTGEFAPQQVECLKCGSPRRVSFRKIAEGSAPLCWTCTYGIRPDEPHRIYLFYFAGLRVFKVGITHSRHNSRLLQHQVSGGKLVESVLVVDRSAALRIETVILALYRPYAATGIGPQQFPQGGWTETWSATDAPALSLPEVCRGAGLTETGDELRSERIFGPAPSCLK